MKNRRYLQIQFLVICIVLFLLVLSDFGIIFVTENSVARILVYVALILDFIATLIMLRKHQ